MRRLKYLLAATLDGSFDFFGAAGDAHVADWAWPWASPTPIHF